LGLVVEGIQNDMGANLCVRTRSTIAE